MRAGWIAMVACVAWGCSGEGESKSADATADAPDVTVSVDAGTPDGGAQDAETPDMEAPVPGELAGAECAPGEVVYGEAPVEPECVISERVSDGGFEYQKGMVRADCTSPSITALLEKRHMVLIPAEITRDVLWLHLGGSGGKPSNTENIGKAATAAGYRYVSLAYTNEPSVGDRCRCEGIGPRPATCEGLIRYEVLYGVDVTDMFDMDPAESIVARLVALLRFLHTERPGEGWDQYLDGDAPAWDRIALSGFSQGGGMAGLVARDHLVDRVIYLSKGAGSAPSILVEPASALACVEHDECESGRCCPLSDLACREPAPDAYCVSQVPVPWAGEGRDVDGDGVGDGDAESRATPASRQFGLIHREEGAWEYSPEVFAGWGMGGRERIVDVDTSAPPYVGVQIWSTGRPPRGACSEHQSMGADACQALGRDGLPVVWPAWTHAMTVELD